MESDCLMTMSLPFKGDEKTLELDSGLHEYIVNILNGIKLCTLKWRFYATYI
jgi:hypothetical protein